MITSGSKCDKPKKYLKKRWYFLSAATAIVTAKLFNFLRPIKSTKLLSWKKKQSSIELQILNRKP